MALLLQDESLPGLFDKCSTQCHVVADFRIRQISHELIEPTVYYSDEIVVYNLICACRCVNCVVCSKQSKDEKSERSKRKSSENDSKRDARQDADAAPKREVHHDQRRRSRSHSNSRADRPVGESTGRKKAVGNGSTRNRSPPAARRRSTSRSSSDSDVVYRKVQSKVDVKRTEGHKAEDSSKRRDRWSPSPVSTSTGKVRPEDSKSAGRRKEEGGKKDSARKISVASYSSDSSASPSPGRRMQSTVIEKPAPTERRKIVASQKLSLIHI